MMRISELAQRTGVPVATVKYYLREGLLPPGERTSATQARYGEEHERRLRLVRALVDAAGLSIERTRAVLAVVDEPPATITALLQRAVDPEHAGETPRASALVAGLGWRVPEGLGPLEDLERSLIGLDASGLGLSSDHLDALGAAVDRIAELEIDRMPTESPEAAVAYAVLGTELVGPVILALRRVAHARHTIERFGDDLC